MHELNASADTCHWGFFDPALPAVLTIESGEEVTIHTVSGGPQVLPGDGFHVPSEVEGEASSRHRSEPDAEADAERT